MPLFFLETADDTFEGLKGVFVSALDAVLDFREKLIVQERMSNELRLRLPKVPPKFSLFQSNAGATVEAIIQDFENVRKEVLFGKFLVGEIPIFGPTAVTIADYREIGNTSALQSIVSEASDGAEMLGLALMGHPEFRMPAARNLENALVFAMLSSDRFRKFQEIARINIEEAVNIGRNIDGALDNLVMERAAQNRGDRTNESIDNFLERARTEVSRDILVDLGVNQNIEANAMRQIDRLEEMAHRIGTLHEQAVNPEAFANGGTVNGPTLALLGEGGLPEAVVPLPDGKSIPVMFIGGGPGGLGELGNVERASDGVAKLTGHLGGLAESSNFLGISAERLLDTFGDVITGTTDLGTALKSLARTVVGSLAGSIGDDIGGTDGDVIGAFISQAGNFLISNFLAHGGVMTASGALPLSYYSRGGVAASPRLAVFGEGSLPEAFVPLPDGRSIPVTMAGAGFGAGPVLNAPVTVNVQAPGGRGGAGGFDPAVAQEFSVSIGRAVREEFDRLLHDSMRPGGPLNPVRIN